MHLNRLNAVVKRISHASRMDLRLQLLGLHGGSVTVTATECTRGDELLEMAHGLLPSKQGASLQLLCGDRKVSMDKTLKEQGLVDQVLSYVYIATDVCQPQTRDPKVLSKLSLHFKRGEREGLREKMHGEKTRTAFDSEAS